MEPLPYYPHTIALTHRGVTYNLQAYVERGDRKTKAWVNGWVNGHPLFDVGDIGNHPIPILEWEGSTYLVKEVYFNPSTKYGVCELILQYDSPTE